MTQRKENWSAGDLYEPYVGRWSRSVARELLGWLDVPRGRDWLDVGCGTGSALCQAIASVGAALASVVALTREESAPPRRSAAVLRRPTAGPAG